MQETQGIITKISGPVLDVHFEGRLPKINDLLTTEDGIHMEVAAHSGTRRQR